MERSFSSEVAELRKGRGEMFRGEGVVAVAKALLQSGVGYVGGYQGAPVSHLLDVLRDARGLLDELGVTFHSATTESAAAALLGASVRYPMRGAVTWKSIVGTNVASDALSHVASAGVVGGAVVILGGDYGPGASVVQERSHAFALKSSVWLLSPRPRLTEIVRSIERAFALSEASSTPVMIEIGIRSCHLYGSFEARDNVAAAISGRGPVTEPAAFDYGRLAHPPATYRQEAEKVTERLPAARRFIREHALNETVEGALGEVGIIVVGGLFGRLWTALCDTGLADAFGTSLVPLLILTATHPLVPEEIAEFCSGKKVVLIVEEGDPPFLEEAVEALLRRADAGTTLLGKGVLPRTGAYDAEALARAALALVAAETSGLPEAEARLRRRRERLDRLASSVGTLLPTRPPTFCTGCPERPVFTALKLLDEELGPAHVAADIGCHSLATFPPFSAGQSILGYGMSLASAGALGGRLESRPVSVMGDGGFWHNGALSGVANALFNEQDGALVVLENGYSSATGQQAIPSTPTAAGDRRPGIVGVLRSLGVRWVRRVGSYRLGRLVRVLREARTDPTPGLKVVVAQGECRLSEQRRTRRRDAERLARGERVESSWFGVDEDVCTGDQSCIRLSGCPSLTLAERDDPLREDPVVTIDRSCVGCGLCGEVAHVARLCPSFYRVDVVTNPSRRSRWLHRVRRRAIGVLERLA